MAGIERQKGLVVDIDTGALRKDHVLVQSTPAAVFFLGFGPRARGLSDFAFGDDSDPNPFIARCRRIAKAIESGRVVKAQRLGVSRSIIELQDRVLRRLAIAEALAKAGYDPDEPRIPAGDPDGGEWISDENKGGQTTEVNVEPVVVRTDETQAKKERFVDAHLADAQKAADQLGVPVENILALSALESGWGEHPFAAEGNNYFGIHYPAPFATWYMISGDGKTKVATFASYAESLRSFVAISRMIVQGKEGPEEFAAALQNSGKFGIHPETGAKVPTYVGSVARTIRGLRSIVARRRI